MKKYLLFIASNIISTFLCGCAGPSITENINLSLPSFSMQTLDGYTITKSELEGKVVILDFWATWCPPCLKEFPHFQEVYEKYNDHPDVVFLSINTAWRKEKIEDARRFIKTNGYTMQTVFDSGSKITSLLKVESIPTILIVDKNSKIQVKRVGFYNPENFTTNITSYIDKFLKNN